MLEYAFIEAHGNDLVSYEMFYAAIRIALILATGCPNSRGAKPAKMRERRWASVRNGG